MLIVHVAVQVIPSERAAFVEATLDNARESLKEPGVLRFDLIEQADDPSRFLLLEVYRDDEAPLAHKETAHYARWRDRVAPMMAAPRSSTKFRALFPSASGWETGTTS